LVFFFEVLNIFFLLRLLLFLIIFEKNKKKHSKQFDDDVYVATSEPHGTIEATVTRGAKTEPHFKLWSRL